MTAPQIRLAAGAADMAEARALFEEYAAWLAIDLCFQGFAEELATLPGTYAPPAGRLLLAGPPGGAVGCIALRPLVKDGVPPGTAEVKRLYVRPAARGGGLGARLVERLVTEARAIGYRALMLDTLDTMREAQSLYRRFGFAECSPYYHNPHPGTVYMRREL
ncbi:MAG: GNAT family N-acetyltransferase [Burkholderiales bacterium]